MNVQNIHTKSTAIKNLKLKKIGFYVHTYIGPNKAYAKYNKLFFNWCTYFHF